MKTYTIFLFCFYLLLFNSCNKNEDNSLPDVWGQVHISVQNKEGENLLANVETGLKDDAIIIRQNVYKLNCIVNGSENNGLCEYNRYLFVEADSVTGENKSFSLNYAFMLYSIPDEGVFRFNFACHDIFGDEEYRSLQLKYITSSHYGYYIINEFSVDQNDVTIEVLNENAGVYHILLTVNDSK